MKEFQEVKNMNFIKENIKNIIIVILLILFIISTIFVYKLSTKEENKLDHIIGTVIIADSTYVIIETEEQDYLIKNIKGTYKIGDEVKFVYYENDLNNEDSIKTVNKISDEELIRTNTEKSETEDSKLSENEDKNTNKFENNSNKNETENNNPATNNNTNNNQNANNANNKEENTNNTPNNNKININQESNADIHVLSYFNELKKDFDSSEIKSSLKSGYVTVVDFFFYGGEIKGYTFSELSTSAKLKVLEIGLYFDSKIEKYFPGYKESISSTTNKIYTSIKEEIVSTYLDLAVIICNEDAELCESATEQFSKIKDTFSLSWSLIKEIAGDGLLNLKNWYEIWRGE